MDFKIEHLVLLITSGIIPLKFASWVAIIAVSFWLLAYVGKKIQSFSESFSGSTKNFADSLEYMVAKIRSIKNRKK